MHLKGVKGDTEDVYKVIPLDHWDCYKALVFVLHVSALSLCGPVTFLPLTFSERIKIHIWAFTCVHACDVVHKQKYCLTPTPSPNPFFVL